MLTAEEQTAIALALFKVRPEKPYTVEKAPYYIQWLKDIRAIAEALKLQNPECDYWQFILDCLKESE